MAKLKTLETDQSVERFLKSVEDQKRKDSIEIMHVIKKVIPTEARMWGTSIIGFGKYHYKYETGHEGDAPLVGLSPRKQSISVYLMPGSGVSDELFQNLGKHKMGKGCLYINRVKDINLDVLEKLVKASVKQIEKTFGKDSITV